MSASGECLALCVPPDQVEEFAHIARPLLDQATRVGDWTADNIWREVCGGDMLLWLAVDSPLIYAVVVTKLTKGPSGLWCSVIAAAGTDMDKWKHLMRDIEAYARAEGCNELRLSGRPGWARVLPDFEMRYVTLGKRLS